MSLSISVVLGGCVDCCASTRYAIAPAYRLLERLDRGATAGDFGGSGVTEIRHSLSPICFVKGLPVGGRP